MTNLGTALYYPNFHMEPEWAKAALLYWDSISRIVPKELQATVDVDDAFAREMVSANALNDLDTTEYIEETARRFDDYLLPIFEKTPEGKFDESSVKDVLGAYYQIHPYKVSNALLNDLTALGVGQDETGFLKVPAESGRTLHALPRDSHEGKTVHTAGH